MAGGSLNGLHRGSSCEKGNGSYQRPGLRPDLGLLRGALAGLHKDSWAFDLGLQKWAEIEGPKKKKENSK